MRAMRGGGGKILNGEKEGLLKRVSGASIFQHPQFHTCSGHLCAPYLKGKPKPFVLRKRIKAVAAPPLMPDGPALSFARSHTLSPSLMPQKCLPNAHKITVYSTQARPANTSARGKVRALQRLAANVLIFSVREGWVMRYLQTWIAVVLQGEPEPRARAHVQVGVSRCKKRMQIVAAVMFVPRLCFSIDPLSHSPDSNCSFSVKVWRASE